MMHKRPWPLYVLLAVLLFQGLSGIGGGIALMIKPDGSLLHMPVSVLHGFFGNSFFIPGLILALILGVFPMVTCTILLAQPNWKVLQTINIYHNRYAGWQLSLFVGLGLIIWMDVEFAIMGNGAIIQDIYSVVSLLIIIFTLTPGVMQYYERENNAARH